MAVLGPMRFNIIQANPVAAYQAGANIGLAQQRNRLQQQQMDMQRQQFDAEIDKYGREQARAAMTDYAVLASNVAQLPAEQQQAAYAAGVANLRQLHPPRNGSDPFDDVPEAFDPGMVAGLSPLLPAGPELPASVREAQWYRSASPEQRAAFESTQAAGRPPGASVTVEAPVHETEGQKQSAKRVADSFDALQAAGQDASTTLGMLRRAEQLAENIQTTGATAPAVQSVKRLATGMGVNLEALGITDDTAPAEALNALTSEFVLQQAEKMAGTISDMDMRMIQTSTPALSQTPEGRQLLIQTQRSIASHTQRLSRHMANWMADNPGDAYTPAYYQEINRYNAENPLFTDADRERFQNAAGVGTVAEAGTRAVPVPGDISRTQFVQPNMNAAQIQQRYSLTEQQAFRVFHAARTSGVPVEDVIAEARRQGKM